MWKQIVPHMTYLVLVMCYTHLAILNVLSESIPRVCVCVCLPSLS